MGLLDPGNIIIPDLNEGLQPDKILIPDLDMQTDAGPLGVGEKGLHGALDKFTGHIVSGAKRVPGDVISGLAAEQRSIAKNLKPETDDDYSMQLQIMTPMDRQRVYHGVVERVSQGMDKKSSLRDSLNESLDEKRRQAIAYAEAFERLAEHKAFQPLPGYENPDSFGAAVLQGIGQQTIRMPLMLLGAPFAVPEMYFEISGATYKHLTDNGVDPDRAMKASRMDALAQAPLEYLGSFIAVKSILGAKGWKALVAGIAESSAQEGLTEFAQQYPDELATFWAMNPEATNQDIMDHMMSGEVLSNAVFSGLVGGTVGGIFAGAGGATKMTLDSFITDVQKGKIEQRRQTLLNAMAKSRIGKALNDEEQQMLDRITETLPEDVIRRIQYQTPIISDARDEAYQGMMQIMGNAERTDAVMGILDSIAHSYGELLGVDPEQFYEKELKVGGKISFEDFQSGERLAAQYQSDPFLKFYRDKNKKYREILNTPSWDDLEAIPEENDIFTQIDDGSATADGISEYLASIEDNETRKEAVLALKSTIADQIGNMLETYRYESTEEGQKIEGYIDHLLRAVEYHDISEKKPLQDNLRVAKKTKPIAKQHSVSSHRRIISTQLKLFQGAPSSPMGATAWTSTGQAVIYAFEGSNVSTPVHEIGHVLLGLIERYDPSSFQAIQSWLKIDETRAKQGSLAWTVEEHERFAKGFEAYMMEGKAPSFRLVSVFKKMKSWLLEIYRRVTKLDVKLNDDVRWVFDQWLTTEEERQADFIKDASNWYDVDETPHPMGELSPDDYQDHDSLAAKATEIVAQKIGAVRKRRDAKVRKNLWGMAKKLIEDDPFWQDIAYLRSVGGLSLDLVKKMRNWGRDEINLFREWGIISGKSNLSPDGFAHSRHLLGGRKYDRAEDFLDYVIDSPKKKDAINKVYADLLEEYEQWKAEEGTTLEDIGEILNAEIRILNNLMGRTGAASKVISREIAGSEDLTFEEVQELKKKFKALDAAAREAFGEGKQQAEGESKDLIETEKQKAKSKLAAFKEKAKGREADLKTKQKDRIAEIRIKNYERILKIKEEQRGIVARLRERQRAQKEKGKIQRRMKRYLKSKSLSYEARYQLQRILAGYFPVKNFKADMTQPDLSTWFSREVPIEGAQQFFRDIINKLPAPWRAEDNTVVMPGRRSLNDMQSVAALADIIVGIDRKKQAEIKAGKLEARKHLAEGMYQKHGLAPKEPDYISGRPNWMERIRDAKDTLMAELTKIEFMCNYLDRFDLVGPVWNALFKPLADAENQKLVMLRQYMKELHSILDPIANDITWTKVKHSVEGYKHKLTREQMFMVALNSGNEGNRKDLVEGNKLPDEVIDRIFNEMLTPQEREAVERIWELLDTLFPHLDQVNRELLGFPLKRVEGHYFPIVHDRKLSWLAAKTEDQNALPDSGVPFYMAYPKAGHRDARTGAIRPLKLDSIEIVSRHIHEAIHDITHTVPVMEVYHTFTDENVRKAIIDICGDKMYQMLTPWIKNISRPDSGPRSILETMGRALRKNTTIVYLGLKSTTEVLQLSALTQSMEELGAVQVGDAIQQMMRNPVDLVRQINDKSVMMRFRGKMYDREFNEFAQQISTGTISKFTDRIGEFALSPIAILDQVAAYPTWLAAYRKGFKQFKGDDEKAIDYADSVVRRTQSAAGPKDLAVIQQGNEFKKWSAMFYTFFSVYWNKTNENHKKAGIEGVTPKAGYELFRSFIYLTAIPAILSFLVVKGGFPEDDEWWKELIAYRIGGYPIVRDIVSPALSGYDYEFSPAAGGLSAVADFVKGAENARQHWLEDEDIKDINGMKIVKDAIWSAGFIYGLPASQAIISMDGIIDLWNDETDNPLRLLFRKPREVEE